LVRAETIGTIIGAIDGSSVTASNAILAEATSLGMALSRWGDIGCIPIGGGAMPGGIKPGAPVGKATVLAYLPFFIELEGDTILLLDFFITDLPYIFFAICFPPLWVFALVCYRNALPIKIIRRLRGCPVPGSASRPDRIAPAAPA
jgi:hypothetical protein